MRFYLTGRIAIEGAATVDQTSLPGGHGRLALVYLTSERHRPVPSQQLAAALWDDRPPPSADTSLRAIVSKLRGVLAAVGLDGAASIVADGGCYQLRVPGAWVDLEAAANAVDRAEGAWRTGDVAGAWSHATVAAAIARRPLLPGDDVGWVAALRGRLRALHVRALTVLTDADLATGQHDLAVALARELVAMEPFREAAYRQLMSAHLASGDRAEALRVYDQLRTLLADELGVEPAPETRAVHLDALRA